MREKEREGKDHITYVLAACLFPLSNCCIFSDDGYCVSDESVVQFYLSTKNMISSLL